MNKKTNLEHIVRFDPGYDCIRFNCKWGDPACKPGTIRSHGWDGIRIRFIVRGDEGVVLFILLTDWIPQYATRQLPASLHIDRWDSAGRDDCDGFYPFPLDLSHHSRDESQGIIDNQCNFLGGAYPSCFAFEQAAAAMYALVNGGDEALWEFMDAYYEHAFHGGPLPDPKEYPTEPRDENSVERSEENIAENAPKRDIAKSDLFDFAAQLVRAMEDERNLIK